MTDEWWNHGLGNVVARRAPTLSLKNEQLVVECGEFSAVRLGSTQNTLRWRFSPRGVRRRMEWTVADLRTTPPDLGHFAIHSGGPVPKELEADDLEALVGACAGLDAGLSFAPNHGECARCCVDSDVEQEP